MNLENLENIEEQEKFKIDSPAKADWAIAKIRQAYRRRDIFLEALQAKKQELTTQEENAKQKAEQETEYLLYLLEEYMETLPYKESKTQKSFEFPAGKLIKKKVKIELVPDKEALVNTLTGTDFVELEPKLKWGEFKKTLKVINDVVVDEYGEIYDCIKIQKTEGKLEIK